VHGWWLRVLDWDQPDSLEPLLSDGPSVAVAAAPAVVVAAVVAVAAELASAAGLQ